MSDASTSVEGKRDTALSPTAKRMRLHRQRRRDGLRCLTIELRETEIDALVRGEMLRADARNDRRAILVAVYTFLDRTLGAQRDA
jgi:hypothetical protein